MLSLASPQLDKSAASTGERHLFRHELGSVIRIGGPLALGELGWMSTYIVDAIMVGHLPHSALAIAASSLGNTIYYAIVYFVIYLMNGLETFIAQAYGRGDREECVRMLAQSMWIVLVGTPVVMVASLGSLRLLPMLGTPPEIVAETRTYLSALVWSTAPLLLYMALRRYLQSLNRVMLISVSLITAGLMNFAGDWAFIYGHLGLPAMGIAGSGWGTCMVRLWMLALLLGGTALAFRRTGTRLTLRTLQPDWPRLWALLRIGFPSGIEYSTELGISTCMSILCARLGTTLLAAHQVVLDLNAFVYMVPAGLSYAAMIRVGQAAGRNNLHEVRRSANASIFLGMGFIVVAAVLFSAFARTWAGLYTNDAAAASAAVPIFLICSLLQLGDAAFVIYASALTGLGDTKTPMAISIVCNWFLGMPLAWLLCFHLHYGLRGLWIGRAIGSISAGVALTLFWQWRMRSANRDAREHRLSLLVPIHAEV